MVLQQFHKSIQHSPSIIIKRTSPDYCNQNSPPPTNANRMNDHLIWICGNVITWHKSGIFFLSQHGKWFRPSAIHFTIFGKSFSHISGSVPVVPSNILCIVQNPIHGVDTFNDWQQSVKSCVIDGIVDSSGASVVVPDCCWVVEFKLFTADTDKRNKNIFLINLWCFVWMEEQWSIRTKLCFRQQKKIGKISIHLWVDESFLQLDHYWLRRYTRLYLTAEHSLLIAPIHHHLW